MNEITIRKANEVATSKFFTYGQNNSGGSFTLDECGITHFVIIDAYSAKEANDRAESIGLDFDGDGDCPCCGERWCEAYDDSDGSDVPEVYGEPADAYVSSISWMPPGKEIAVHYLDGTVRWHGVFKKEKKQSCRISQ